MGYVGPWAIYKISKGKPSAKGSRYYTHILASSERPLRRGPSHLVKELNLGSEYPFPPENWKLICELLEDRMRDQQRLDLGIDIPIEIRREVANLARRLARKQPTH